MNGYRILIGAAKCLGICSICAAIILCMLNLSYSFDTGSRTGFWSRTGPAITLIEICSHLTVLLLRCTVGIGVILIAAMAERAEADRP